MLFNFNLFSLFTPQGLKKLEVFTQSLETLKQSITLKTEAEGEKPKIPIASEYSIKTLDDMIRIAKEMKQNNKLGYWRKDSKAKQLESFLAHFDGQMNTFAPACFDELSYKIAKIYWEVLSQIDISKDIETAARNVVPLHKLLPFVIDNTAQLIQLYEFVADDLRANPSLNRLEPPESHEELYECICSMEFLLEHMHKPDDVYEEMIKYYCQLFGGEEQPTVLPPLTVALIIKKYEERVAVALPKLLETQISEMNVIGISTACLDEPTSTITGQLIGSQPIVVTLPNQLLHEPVNCFDFIEIQSGFKGWLLLNLLLKEQELLKKISETECKISCNGVTSILKKRFDHQQYQELFGNFKQWLEMLRKKLNNYVRSSHYLKNDNKLSIAKGMAVFLNQILGEISNSSDLKSLNQYLAAVFKLCLKASFTHNVIVGQTQISHGELGKIFTAALNELYAQLKKISIHTIPDIFSHVLSRDEYQKMLAGEKIECSLSKDGWMLVSYNKVNSIVETNDPRYELESQYKKIVLNSQLPSIKTLVKHHMLLNGAMGRQAKRRKEAEERNAQANNSLAMVPYEPQPKIK